VICLLVQPIHPAGIAVLREAGLEVRQASAATMDVVAREIAGADAAITRNAGLSAAAMDAAPRLKVLGNHGIGTDPVDLGRAREIGLPVVFTPTSNVQSVAEHALGQMLAIAKRTREADAAVRDGRFDYRDTRDFVELHGKTLAILGFGTIGRRTAELARAAFAMRVVVHSRSADPADVAAAGFEPVADLDEALGQADVVSLHQRLTPDNRGLFDRARLARMKPGSMLVNTARGALVDSAALAWAVTDGPLRGAAMDVFAEEPLPAGHLLTDVPGVVLSPHIGGATEEAMARTAVDTARQVADVLAGRRPAFLVDPDVWDRRRA